MPKPPGKATKPPVKRDGPPPANRAPESTHEEVRYLKHLIDNGILVRVRLAGDEEVEGTIEYYDASFIRLTRTAGPNLFIFKHDIKYLYEVAG